jgi:mannose-6-phosphate isomerase class I
MKKEVLFLEPVFKQMIWGGSRLREVFGYQIPGEDTGECWAISAHPNGDGKIAGGTYDGRYLSDLWANERQLFGNAEGDTFPLLVKLIDAKADLSIQVHPDDAYAKAHENGSLGKEECWYIVDCDEDATIVIGHNAGTREELRAMVEAGRWKELIREIPIKKGDFFQIEPGCLHAIKGGTLLLETQQSSDITYRVYDYDRLAGGKPRQLHKEQSLQVIRCPHRDSVTRKEKETYPGYERELLVRCPLYQVEHICIKTQAEFPLEAPFVLVSVLEGEGTINTIPIRKGQHFIIPADFGPYAYRGQLELIQSTL